MRHSITSIETPFQRTLSLPGSLPLSYRAILLAALADGVSELSGLCINDDILAYLNALHQLGIVTQLNEKTQTCIITGCNAELPKNQANVWCAGTRTITRYLFALCAISQGVFYFDSPAALRRHSYASLLNILGRQGIQLIPSDAHHLPLTLVTTDSLEGGDIKLNPRQNTQLLSPLLMIAPYARTAFNFMMDDLYRQPFLEMTCQIMADFGVMVHRVHQGQYMVPVPQRYQAKNYVIEPDFSLAVYFLAAAAITNSEITILALDRHRSKQPDIKFLTILEKMGCVIHDTLNGFRLKGTDELQGIEVSLHEFNDTFLALIAIAPFAKSPIRITHMGEFNTKETQRLIQVKTILTQLGIPVETGKQWIKLFPGIPKAGTIATQEDMGLAQAFTLLSLRTPGIAIEITDTIDHAYSTFLTLLNKPST